MEDKESNEDNDTINSKYNAYLHEVCPQQILFRKNLETEAAHKEVDFSLALVLRQIQFTVIFFDMLNHFVVCLLLS